MNTRTVVGQTQRVTLPIRMGCSSDAPGIERALLLNRGIVKVYANPVTEMVYIEYDPALIEQEQMIMVVKHAGFGLVTGGHDDHECHH